MINSFGKQRRVDINSTLSELPSMLICFTLSARINKSTVVEYLSENDESFAVSDSVPDAFEVYRLLNKVEIMELMSFMVPLRKKISVRMGDEMFPFDCFRAAIYAYVNCKNAEWQDDMVGGFTEGTQEETDTTKMIYNSLLNLREHEQR